ncbi:hypothetical protein CR51_31880 [Caballeronia megalochromosomata]|nr:hypothetical protein CR51_31880 [Caballeronia megalochromosomata]
MWQTFSPRVACQFIGFAEAGLLHLLVHDMSERRGVERRYEMVVSVVLCVVAYQPIQLFGASMRRDADLSFRCETDQRFAQRLGLCRIVVERLQGFVVVGSERLQEGASANLESKQLIHVKCCRVAHYIRYEVVTQRVSPKQIVLMQIRGLHV